MINIWITWPLRLDDRLRWDADSSVVHRQLLAGQTLRPRMVVLLHDRLAAALGPLAHGLAGLDGVVLEVDGAYGRVHGAQEEQQVRAALGAQEPLELLDGEHGVGLRAVMEVVGHLGHVPRHGPAHGDADGLAGRGRGASGDLQETGDGQEADEHLVGIHVFGDKKKIHNWETTLYIIHQGNAEIFWRAGDSCA